MFGIKTIQERCSCRFWHFSYSKRAQLPAIRITEQPILLINGKINRQSIFTKNGYSNVVLILVLIL